MSKLRDSSSHVFGSRDGGWRLCSPGSVVTAAVLLEAGRRTDTELCWRWSWRGCRCPAPGLGLPHNLATIAAALAEAD